jgi:hypothetical protein
VTAEKFHASMKSTRPSFWKGADASRGRQLSTVLPQVCADDPGRFAGGKRSRRQCKRVGGAAWLGKVCWTAMECEAGAWASGCPAVCVPAAAIRKCAERVQRGSERYSAVDIFCCTVLFQSPCGPIGDAPSGDLKRLSIAVNLDAMCRRSCCVACGWHGPRPHPCRSSETELTVMR